MSDSSPPEEKETSLQSVKLVLRSSPEVAAGIKALSRQAAELGRIVNLASVGPLRSLAEAIGPMQAISQALAAQNREALKPILDSFNRSLQLNESIRGLAQQMASLSGPSLSLSEVIRFQEHVQIDVHEEQVVDDSLKGAYELHDELLSYLKVNRTNPGVVTVVALLVAYLAGKDEILESATEHIADVQRALEVLWDFAALLLSWLGRTTS